MPADPHLSAGHIREMVDPGTTAVLVGPGGLCAGGPGALGLGGLGDGGVGGGLGASGFGAGGDVRC